ncbi:Starch-binding associating with outer membrane [Catalinimonas alkaloidigena]|uniref:Starch-binding associating with outer membrane n=1 Tax=Catalinimonas alkaloidigena TaxID=1075417 RepID=A0A1G9G9J6_9BACT|nr:RagB/SusD family nutrient uptake outer membrane protein [Catalinimonas alkaloidigena]SDK96953.1 Starch-binding associating with outer membrane [Catalinimonas alkaloidigena]
MTILKNFFSTGIKVAAFVVLAGCSDFLEKPLQGELTQENFPVSQQDALLATNAIYNVQRQSGFNQGLFPILDIMSDDGLKGSNPDDGASSALPYDNFTYLPTEGNLSRWWNTLYEGVKRANVVVELVPGIAMDAGLRDRYVGEARFLRALFYFDLVRAWGGVPLVTTTAPETNLRRASADEVYALIEQDLLAAINALPEKSDYSDADLGRATKGAAKALLAKMYLFRNDFANAEKYALEVINSGQYSLEPNFEDANGVNGEHGVESVYEIGAMPFATENGGNQYGNVQGVRGTPNRGWGFNRPSLDLQNSFETGDPRLDATVIYLGEVLDGVTIQGDGGTPDETYDANGNLVQIECYNQKVWTPGTNTQTQFGYNRRVIRYADVLLMAAEALNKNNKSAEALTYLNQVRARARGGNSGILPDITETDPATLDDLIFTERRHELAMESHRFFDLVRTGRAATVLGPLGYVEGKHNLLAIPQTEIDLSQGTIEQNPNWQ